MSATETESEKIGLSALSLYHFVSLDECLWFRNSVAFFCFDVCYIIHCFI